VIAFAITLLILDIRLQDVPADIGNTGMIRALLAMAPHFSIYVISFLSCTVWWVSHHELIDDLDHVDPRLLWLNSLFPMWVVVLPFTTGLLGHHPRQPIAVALFGAVCAITCATFSLMRWYASFRGRLMKNEINEVKLRRDLGVSLSFPFLYLASAAVGLFLPSLALLSYATIPAFFTIQRLFNRRDNRTIGEHQPSTHRTDQPE
jgi:uncharacterized membrane protein